MNKQSITVCVLFISLVPYSSHSHEVPQAYLHLNNNQEFSKKSSTINVLEICIAQAVPIAVGKCVVSWIKNRKNNKTKHSTSNKPYILIKKQEPVYYPIEKIDLPEKSISSFCKKTSKQLLNQLSNLRDAYREYRILNTNYSKRLSLRTRALQQSFNENFQCSLYKSNWSDIDFMFIDVFNLNGIKFQHVLQKEFHDIAQKMALVWTLHKNNVASKKLQAWKQNFIELVDTISEQWQVTPSRDITKLVSCFTTELFLTGKAFRSLDGLFSFARINGTKLISKAQKITESILRITTPEGITTYINKAVKHTRVTAKTGHTAKRVTTKFC